jgi:hypothetical protein
MKNEIGYEHYFINYFLFIPFSKVQEENTIQETVKIIAKLGIVEFIDHNEIKIFYSKVLESMECIKKYSSMEVDKIKNSLNLPNKNLAKDYKLYLTKNFNSESKMNINFNMSMDNNQCFDNNDPILSKIIYGDYKYKNENVETFLHQRTMKKVKYKKREYDLIHPINKDIIGRLVNNTEIFYNTLNNIKDSVDIATSERISKDLIKIKHLYSKQFKIL